MHFFTDLIVYLINVQLTHISKSTNLCESGTILKHNIMCVIYLHT